MPAIRPLSIMLRALSWAAAAAWPAGVASAVLWTGRAEVALLSVAVAGTSGAVTLRVLSWAEARQARRAAEYERLERLLVGAIADLYNARRPTIPLRVIRGHRP